MCNHCIFVNVLFNPCISNCFFFNNRVNSNTYFKVLGVNLDTLMSADDIKREGRDKDEEINEAVNSILLGNLCILVAGECFGPKLSSCQSYFLPIW